MSPTSLVAINLTVAVIDFVAFLAYGSIGFLLCSVAAVGTAYICHATRSVK